MIDDLLEKDRYGILKGRAEDRQGWTLSARTNNSNLRQKTEEEKNKSMTLLGLLIYAIIILSIVNSVGLLIVPRDTSSISINSRRC